MLVRWSFPLIEWHCKWRSYQPIVDLQVLNKGQLCSYGQLVLDILNLSSHFLCHCVTSALLITSDAFVREDTSRDPAPCSRPWLHLFHHNHNNLSMVKIWNGTLYALHVNDIKSSQYTQTSFKQVFVDPSRKKFYEHRSELTVLTWEVITLIGCGPLENFDKFEVVERTSDYKLDELYNPGEIYVGFGEERKTYSHHYVHSTR